MYYYTCTCYLGLDFSLLNSTVQFSPNDLTQRIYFYINNDDIVELTEQFSLSLVPDDSSVTIAGNNSVYVQILDDDGKPVMNACLNLISVLLNLVS